MRHLKENYTKNYYVKRKYTFKNTLSGGNKVSSLDNYFFKVKENTINCIMSINRSNLFSRILKEYIILRYFFIVIDN